MIRRACVISEICNEKINSGLVNNHVHFTDLVIRHQVCAMQALQTTRPTVTWNPKARCLVVKQSFLGADKK